MIAKVVYNGNLRTTCTHQKSNDTFITDAPVDNNGLGEAFSPTDTVATALGSCMLTIMGIKAKEMNIALQGSTATINKIMASNPRRIATIEVTLILPKNITAKNRTILERAANSCPVHHSLHPSIKKVIHYNWSLD